ncbi:MAG: hypothetical protein KJ630_01275 [Proteobacteria bacterium]|nr:hypothetical protein [Pseudomonadota bacterium]
MRIWIPEPLYQIFPRFNVLLGLIFMIVASGKVSLGLALALIGYGLSMALARAVGR